MTRVNVTPATNEALRKAARSHGFGLTASQAEQLAAVVLVTQRGVPQKLGMALTPRRLQMLRLIAQGLQDREIGAELFISVNSAKTTARLLFKSMGARNRAHAVALGFKHGLLRMEDIPDE